MRVRLELERPGKGPVNASQRPDLEPQEVMQEDATEWYTPARLL